MQTSPAEKSRLAEIGHGLAVSEKKSKPHAKMSVQFCPGKMQASGTNSA
jgi:hypothetical protein